GCSSNWQSSGFQIRVLGVRISPPLPSSKASAEMLRLFRMRVSNQSSGFRHYQRRACWKFVSFHPWYL
ncbi:hypothetical protein, partial [Vibrio europaeus]|uniref:hypothetical protein n=1 Tax=Vibrio europaeus TaxID=300876 RepID=UPI00233E9CA4